MLNKKGQGAPAFVSIFVLLAMISMIFILVGVDTVKANELGVMEQMGKIKGVQQPGIKYTGLLTTVEKYDMRTRKVVVNLIGDDAAADKDGQSIVAVINVNYVIKRSEENVMNLYKNVGQSDVVADKLNLDAIIAEGFKQSTVNYEALEILAKRQEVKDLAIENIVKNFPSEYFEIQTIVITNIDYLPAFKNAIERKKVATQEKLREEIQLDVVKFQQMQEIEKYKAEAEKMRLQRQEITPLLIQQSWIQKWNGELPVTMLSSGEATNFLLQIPAGTSQATQ